MGGLGPVLELMSINFSLVAMDQIVNNAAKIHYMFDGQFRLPLVIRTPAGWGQLAATHSQSFEAWYASLPGLVVVMPATPADAKGLLKTAIGSDNPVMFIEHARLYGVKGEVPAGDYTLPIGVAEVTRPGRDVTIVSYSRMLHESLRAAEELANLSGTLRRQPASLAVRALREGGWEGKDRIHKRAGSGLRRRLANA